MTCADDRCCLCFCSRVPRVEKCHIPDKVICQQSQGLHLSTSFFGLHDAKTLGSLNGKVVRPNTQSTVERPHWSVPKNCRGYEPCRVFGTYCIVPRCCRYCNHKTYGDVVSYQANAGKESRHLRVLTSCFLGKCLQGMKFSPFGGLLSHFFGVLVFFARGFINMHSKKYTHKT